MRDADVLLQRLGEAVDGLDGSDQEAGRLLLDRVEADRKPHLAALHEALDSRRYLDLTQALVDLAVTPPIVEEPDRPAREAYPELASRPWEHLSKRVSALGKHPTDAELHRVRILAKRARYAAEAASAVIPAAGRHAEAIAGLQGVLGDHQDAVVAQQWLRDSIASDATAPEAFVAGLLVRDEQALAGKYRRRWPDAWAEADRKKLSAWLTP